MPYIHCTCGAQIFVKEAQAGTRVRCHCDQELVVPPLSVLRLHPRGEGSVPAEVSPQRTDWADTAEREFLFLFTNQECLARRISHESLFHFVAACERLVRKYFEQLEQQRGVDVQVACALLPNGKTLADVQIQPDVLAADVSTRLIQQLEQLPSPPVEEGPVAFAARKVVGGGGDRHREFDVPFAKYFHRTGELDELLMEAGGPLPRDSRVAGYETPSGRSLWARIKSLFSWRERNVPVQRISVTQESSQQPGSVPGADEWADRLAHQCVTPEEVEDQIHRNPNVAPLFQRLGDLQLEAGELERAIAAYTEFVRLDPDNTTAYASRGHAYCLAGNMRQGLSDYTTAIELDPENVGCLAARGAIFLELEAWNRAEVDFSAAIDNGPRHPGLFVERARSCYLQDKVEQALSDLDMALSLDPHHETAYALRGTARQQQPNVAVQDVEDAVQDFTLALEIASDKAWYYAQRAEAYSTLNKFTLAIADCDRALELDGECELGYGVRGFANQQLENYAEAIADCSEAIKLGLETVAVYMSRASALAVQGEIDQAISDCDAALVLVPDFAAAFNLRGTFRLAQGDVESAMQDFSDACRLAPDWATPYGQRANAHRVRAEHELAIEEYTRAIELEPTNLMALVNRSLTWMDLGEFDKALHDLDEVLRIDSDFAAGYFHRAELLLHQDELDRALEDLDRAIALQPDFGPAYFVRAQVLLHQGMNEHALRDYNTLIQLNPTLPAGFIGRANAWIHIGDQEKASDDYREAVNLDPASAEEFLTARLLAEARCLHEKEDYAGAIAKASEAIENDPENVTAYAARAASFWYSEQCVEAVDDYSQLLKLMPDAGYAYGGRGQAYAEMGEYEAALLDLDRAIDMAHQAKSKVSLAYSLNGRALAYAGLERFEDADRDFDQSIQLCPQNAWAHYNRGLMYRTMGNLEQARVSLRKAVELKDPPLTRRKRDRANAFLANH